MDAMSPWIAAIYQYFAGKEPHSDYCRETPDFTFEAFNTGDSFWVTIAWKKSRKLAFRAAYAPDATLELLKTEENEQEVVFNLRAHFGEYTVRLNFPAAEPGMLHSITTLVPSVPLHIPFWPRDCVPLNGTGGKVHLAQKGLRSGLVYGTWSHGGFLYFQNLSSINQYAAATHTTLSDTVGGRWPELGFSLPATIDKPLPAGKPCVISDAYLLPDMNRATKELALGKQFINLLARIYVQIPSVKTTYRNWLDVLKKSLHDLEHSSGCWSQMNRNVYLNAYVSDYNTPPESMVQLAVLLPLTDYEEWSGNKLKISKQIRDGLNGFYDERTGSLMRWLVAAEDKLDNSEEHKKPRVMDSWYLHHPLLNLSRLAQKGDKSARKLLLDSMDYLIRVARHFKYDWPVFYNVDTLEVIKAETQPGKGGERDVPGIYAHVMLQAWQLTKERKYLLEAKRAARALLGRGFDIFYQANNTAFAAGAMLRLWKETGDDTYLDLSYLCLANIFKNVWLWDCDYGNAKYYQTFFALFPLNDAPYTAVYEELEGFSAFHDYLNHVDGLDIMPEVQLLLAEYIKHMMHRSLFYYPGQLPSSALSEDVKSGEVDPRLWIPLEDLQDGWSKSGTVGQEVYGAGLPFAIVPRHYFKVMEANMMVYVDYPTSGYSIKNRNTLSFDIKGDRRMPCRMMLIPLNDEQLPDCSVMRENEEVKGKKTPEGCMEFILQGDQKVTVKWRTMKVPKGRRTKVSQLIKSL